MLCCIFLLRSSWQGAPRLVDDSSGCEYIFRWKSSAACPLQAHATEPEAAAKVCVYVSVYVHDGFCDYEVHSRHETPVFLLRLVFTTSLLISLYPPPPTRLRQDWNAHCKLTDPITAHVYDFNLLAKGAGDYSVRKDGVTYHINVCKVGSVAAGFLLIWLKRCIPYYPALSHTFTHALRVYTGA